MFDWGFWICDGRDCGRRVIDEKDILEVESIGVVLLYVCGLKPCSAREDGTATSSGAFQYNLHIAMLLYRDSHIHLSGSTARSGYCYMGGQPSCLWIIPCDVCKRIAG